MACQEGRGEAMENLQIEPLAHWGLVPSGNEPPEQIDRFERRSSGGSVVEGQQLATSTRGMTRRRFWANLRFA